MKDWPRYWAGLAVCACVALVAGCGRGDADSSQPDAGVAVSAALADGPVTAAISTTSAVGDYTIDGDLDADGDSYRLCGEVTEKPDQPYEGDSVTVFMGDGAGEYRTLMKFEPEGRGDSGFTIPGADRPPCSGQGWLDDHPPSLALFQYGPDGGPSYPTGGEFGAESYMQLALLALTRFDAGAGPALSSSGDEIKLPFDFLAADERPKGRNEDRWQMEPLLRRTGETELTLTTEEGRLASLSFTAPGQLGGKWSGPVDVSVVLGDPGSGESVDPAVVYAME